MQGRAAHCVQSSRPVRLSGFNLYVANFPERGATLVQNTLSGGFTVLDEETLAALRKADAGLPLDEHERALATDPDLSDPDVGVMVESREAEDAEFLAWFERRRRRTTSLDALVSINLACNFECPYCSQAEIMNGSVMKPEMADRTGDWLAERALAVGVEAVHIAFCGGEPLLHPERIKRIASRIRERVAPHGLTVSFGLITNGYFLTDEMVTDLLPYGLTNAQVTLDGDESTHCLTRVSKKGENTFERLFANTLAASRRIRIAINGNYTEQTVHGFIPLARKLQEAGMPRGTRVRFTPALEGLTSLDWNGGGMCTWSEADTSLHISMQDEILRRGFETAGLAEVGPCEFHDHHSFAIDPDGVIYKCPGFLGRPEWGVGHVTRGLEGDLYDRLIAATPQTSCTGCAHRPNCGGGCVAAEWVKSGVPDGTPVGVNCEKPFFEQVKEEAVTRRFLIATSDSAEQAAKAFPAPKQATQDRSRPRRPAGLRVLST
jgi:uncharacterized protein